MMKYNNIDKQESVREKTIMGRIIESEHNPIQCGDHIRFAYKVKSHRKTTIEELSNRVDTISDRLDALTIRVDVLTDRVDKLTDRVDILTDRVDKLTDRVDKLTYVVENLVIEMRNGFKQINERIDNLVAKNNLIE